MSNKSIFVCQNCGYESIQWLGRCPSCKEFTTFSEEIILKNEKNIFAKTVNKKSIPSLVNEIITPNYQKIPTNDIEFLINRIFTFTPNQNCRYRYLTIWDFWNRNINI